MGKILFTSESVTEVKSHPMHKSTYKRLFAKLFVRLGMIIQKRDLTVICAAL